MYIRIRSFLCFGRRPAFLCHSSVGLKLRKPSYLNAFLDVLYEMRQQPYFERVLSGSGTGFEHKPIIQQSKEVVQFSQMKRPDC